MRLPLKSPSAITKFAAFGARVTCRRSRLQRCKLQAVLSTGLSCWVGLASSQGTAPIAAGDERLAQDLVIAHALTRTRQLPQVPEYGYEPLRFVIDDLRVLPSDPSRWWPSKPLAVPFPGGISNLSEYPNTWFLAAPGGLKCVATAIGPRSLLTAGHCVEPDTQYTLKQGQGTLQAKCKSLYTKPEGKKCESPSVRASDMAVCTLLPEESGVLLVSEAGYETVVVQPGGTQATVSIQIPTWPGCSEVPTDSSLVKVSTDVSSWPAVDQVDVARASRGQVEHLCQGDSGAPWFKLSGEGRKLIAVHVCPHGGSESWGVALDQKESRSFLETEEDPTKAQICGITQGLKTCR